MTTLFEAALPWPLMTPRSMGRSRSRPVRRVVRLDAGQTLRIIDGAETQIVAVRGVLWITEEGDSADNVLAAGDAYEVQYGGKALVSAQERARVLLEVPAGAAMPSSVHVVSPADERGLRIDMLRGARYLSAMHAIGRVVRAASCALLTRDAVTSTPRTRLDHRQAA